MKTEYDVKVPRNQYGNGKYATAFWDFYDGDHKTVKYTFDTIDDAKKLYKRFYCIIYNNNLKDVLITRREKSIYLEKYIVEN